MTNIIKFLSLAFISFITYADTKQDFLKYQQGFTKYKQQQQQEFANYLEEHWRKFKLLKGEKMPLKPKPKRQPKLKGVDVPKPILTPKPKPIPTPKIKPKVNQWLVNFYGQPIVMGNMQQKKLFARQPRSVNVASTNNISTYWGYQDNKPEQLIDKLKKVINKYNLDDWSSYLLVKLISEDLYSNGKNAQVIAQWRLLYGLGFDARIAIASGNYALLLPLAKEIYNVNFIRNSGKKFYIFSSGKNQQVSLQTLDKIPEAKRIFSRFNPAMIRWQRDKKMINQRHIAFEYNKQKVKLKVDYDTRLVSLEQDYPAFKFAYYFAYNPNSTSSVSLKKQLRPYLRNKSKPQKAQFLLSMIQQGIKYKTDAQQFGHERYLFPEETLHYPYADCEDRSFLYGWLVKEIAGIDYLGLYYPNHIATAVNVRAKGAGVYYKNQRYLVADPTYIGAKIGKAMMKNPKIVYKSR